MTAPISIRLDDKVREEAQARARNIGLSSLFREIATEAARQAKRKRIREQTEAVGKYVATHPEAQEVYKLRPAIIVEDHALFGPSYPNLILVPISEDAGFAAPELSLVIDPTPENGCAKRSYALSHCVTTNSKQRVRPTQSRILPEQLRIIRRQISLAAGLE
jgi:mRNA interferase MazF